MINFKSFRQLASHSSSRTSLDRDRQWLVLDDGKVPDQIPELAWQIKYSALRISSCQFGSIRWLLLGVSHDRE